MSSGSTFAITNKLRFIGVDGSVTAITRPARQSAEMISKPLARVSARNADILGDIRPGPVERPSPPRILSSAVAHGTARRSAFGECCSDASPAQAAGPASRKRCFPMKRMVRVPVRIAAAERRAVLARQRRTAAARGTAG
ncbi:hypothetical protein [Burkholderia stabilis]|uniref:hypothetical protein n=1 Tax=Burkholderia stabilis TaxID=95485 RepID=UPI0016451740|nr:hypothetical protein [Burkholderia stabilis]